MKTIENIKIIGRNCLSFDVVEEGNVQIVFAPFDRSNNNLEKQAFDYLNSLNK